MRTDEIIDMVDHTIQDIAVSPDAVRWTPDPEAVDHTISVAGPQVLLSDLNLVMALNGEAFLEVAEDQVLTSIRHTGWSVRSSTK